jgi:hypothetical protein
VNPSSIPSLESIVAQQHQVYREEDEADYYNNDLDCNDDDEPSCNPKQTRTVAVSDDKSRAGIALDHVLD